MPDQLHSTGRIPRATYRFQFNEHFHLNEALALVPYLYELGVSHIYASPLFAACPHSLHGYDVCDFNRLNAELGTEADLAALVTALQARNMGLVLDIVPNHMGIGGPENIWWWDVLTHGEKSVYAGHFDIDWQPAEAGLQGKILAPVLGDDYRVLLDRGEFQLRFENRQFRLAYHEHQFPLTPASTVKLPDDDAGLKKFNADFTALDGLIRQQNYLLAHHQTGDARLNYRRFFAVSTLAAVRVEDEKVFHDTHGLLRRWYEKGWIDGLRVDHPDGLRDPQKYLDRLRRLAPNAWIVVEKILEPQEALPAEWPVAGTTGYDFLNQLNGLLVDAGREKTFTDFYAEFTGETTDYATLVRGKKRAVLKTLLAAEINRLAGLLIKIAARSETTPGFAGAAWREALAEIIVCFPVYRSYISSENNAIAPADRAIIKSVIQDARAGRPDLPPEIFSWVQELLLKNSPDITAQNFVARFQQLTGPVMAKGVEDTAFYCYNRFTSLNEVGGAPEKFGVSLETFHEFLQQRQKQWPDSQLATSTHDTKRAEDVRARLAVISEIPGIWRESVLRWSKMNERHRRDDFPDRNTEYLFYQTLAGAWPLSIERAQFYMEKSAHESRQHTTWTARNAPYENALHHFVSETLRDPVFTGEIERFVAGLAEAAAVNSLAQTLIKLTAPGVPDIYQGCELWDLSLVDPDNRRPVDFDLRRRLLAEIKSFSADQVWAERAQGWPKLWLIEKTLGLRARHPNFSRYDYAPLFARGERAKNIAGFARGGSLITIVPRLVAGLKNGWSDTTLELPAGNWRNVFTGENFTGILRPETFFKKFPVALLARKENE